MYIIGFTRSIPFKGIIIGIILKWSDGIENAILSFNSVMEVKLKIAEEKGHLVIYFKIG